MRGRTITDLIEAVQLGEADAHRELFATAYQELHRLAHAQRRRWRGAETLTTTALIHEAYIKLVPERGAKWQNRSHFFATASRAMRHILVNYAERDAAAKRGAQARRVPLEDVALISESLADDLLELAAQLDRLEGDNARRCRVVECRVFGGLTVEETADALGISSATVKREWQIACATLKQRMRPNVEALREV